MEPRSQGLTTMAEFVLGSALDPRGYRSVVGLGFFGGMGGCAMVGQTVINVRNRTRTACPSRVPATELPAPGHQARRSPT